MKKCMQKLLLIGCVALLPLSASYAAVLDSTFLITNTAPFSVTVTGYLSSNPSTPCGSAPVGSNNQLVPFIQLGGCTGAHKDGNYTMVKYVVTPTDATNHCPDCKATWDATGVSNYPDTLPPGQYMTGVYFIYFNQSTTGSSNVLCFGTNSTCLTTVNAYSPSGNSFSIPVSYSTGS